MNQDEYDFVAKSAQLPSDTDNDEAADHFSDVTDIKWELTGGRVISTV